MKTPAFVFHGTCERCKKDGQVSKTGICQPCLETLLAVKGNPVLKAIRLKELKQSENGVIRFARGAAAAQTTQRDVKITSRLEKQAKQSNQDDLLRFRRVRESTPEKLASLRPPDILDVEIASLNTELFAYLRRNTYKLYELSPRRFEELIAEILHNMGCEVELTPATRDGGRDILAWFATPLGRFLTIVECKRYSPERKIGLDIVERFLYTIVQKDKASCGLLATTSFFSSEVKATARKHEYQLQLADFDRVKEWVGQYGDWTQTASGGLWIPPA